MRIKHKPSPQVGDIRQVTKFLLFPLTLEDETRWLEVATFTEKYMKTTVDLMEYAYLWIPIYWGTPKCKHGHENWDECPVCGH